MKCYMIYPVHQAQMLIASRYVPGGMADMSSSRRALSWILNRTFGLVLALPFRDLSSGFRLYNRDMLLALRPAARDFDVLEELLIDLYVKGCAIREVRPRQQVRFPLSVQVRRHLWRELRFEQVSSPFTSRSVCRSWSARFSSPLQHQPDVSTPVA